MGNENGWKKPNPIPKSFKIDLFILRFQFQSKKSSFENWKLWKYSNIHASHPSDPEICEIISKSPSLFAILCILCAIFSALFFHWLDIIFSIQSSIAWSFFFKTTHNNASFQFEINPSKSHLNFFRFFFRYFSSAPKMYRYITDSIKSFESKREKKFAHEIIRKDFIEQTECQITVT